MNRLSHGERHPLQPTMDGKINGVIATWEDTHNGHPRSRTALQCQDCGLVEHPWPLVNMTILFNPRHEDHKRRCPECRLARMETEYPDCPCHGCTDLRKEARR